MENLEKQKQSEIKNLGGKNMINKKYVCNEILYFIREGFEEMGKKEKKKMLKYLDKAMWRWIRKHSDYYDLAGDGEEWDELECMDFVLCDLFHDWYDMLANDLGEDCYDEMDRKLRESYELEAKEAAKLNPVDKVKVVDYGDDDLPF